MHNLDISDILSIIAIIVSGGLAIHQWRRDSHANLVNLEADYFKELYMEHLLHQLPRARTYLHFQNGILKDIDNLLDELNAIRNDSLYFMYVDSEFYQQLKCKLQELEDYIIVVSDQYIEKDNHQEVFDNIQMHLEELYKILSNKYHGK